MPYCYSYGRHSTVKQDMTKEQQRDRCYSYWKHWLKPHGIEWGGFFYDDAVSAKKPWSEREEGRKIFLSAAKGDHIVTAKYDRCFRRVLDGLHHLEQLMKRGVLFHSEKERLDTSTLMGESMQTVMLLFGQMERGMASERAVSFIEHQKSRCLPYSKGTAMGYRKIKAGDRWQYRVDADEQDICARMYHLHQDGASYERLYYSTRKILKSLGVSSKRTWSHPNYCKWAVLAYDHNFPVNYASYQEFFKALKAGNLDERTLADAALV